MSRYHQGQYKPINKKKYIGDIDNIWYRSGWELQVFHWLDKTEAVKAWSSEEIVVPYISPMDGRYHRYFVDNWARIVTQDGSLVEYLIEIKPKKQLLVPKKPKKQSKRYVEQVTTYLINRAKWDAAQVYADQNNMKFLILTEDQLFGKKKT